MQYVVLGSVLLLLSLVVAPTESMWLAADWGLYIALQSVLNHWPSLCAALALLSTKWGNWIMLCFMISSLAPWLLTASRESLAKRLAAASLYALVFFSGFRIIDRWLVCHVLELVRCSPSAIVPSWVDVTYAFQGVTAKVFSYSSFPSDHGMQHALMLLWSLRYCRVYSPVVLCIGICFNIPRLATGSHWLSDVLVGGLGIAMLLYACFIASPVGAYLENLFERGWRMLLRMPPSPVIKGSAPV